MRVVFFLIIFLISTNFFSQQLDIKETLKYIEDIENEYRKDFSVSTVKYEITEDGYLIQNEYSLKDRSKLTEKISVHVDDIILKVSLENWNEYYISLKCKNKNCFAFTSYDKEKIKTDYKNDNDYIGKLEFVVRQEYQAKKMINAINYLFSLIKNENFLRDSNDPFANNIINSDLKSNNTERIYLIDKNGTYTVNVKFKSLNIPFVLDSGAAEMSISKNIEKQLIENAIITKNDYLPDGLYKLADGRIVTQRRVLLRQVTVGKFTVKNVPASIGDENSPLLLGKNFLDKFKNWSINNSDKTLELKI